MHTQAGLYEYAYLSKRQRFVSSIREPLEYRGASLRDCLINTVRRCVQLGKLNLSLEI